MKKLAFLAIFASLGLISTAQAHDAWLAPAGDAYEVVYGHAGQVEAYEVDKVKAVSAWNSEGDELAIKRAHVNDTVTITVEGDPAMMTLVFDNGYWSKAKGGKTVNLPKSQNPGAETSSHPIKFHKNILRWSEFASTATGVQAEIIPLSATQPKAGDMFAVQVLFEGKPAAGWKIALNDAEDSQLLTDADGKAVLSLTGGETFVSAAHRFEVSDDPETDVYAVNVNLVFTTIK
ncbi:DUF4198 domain-containing protein [Paenalcaligenes niemegkensis]|uniref:DUF4198 domain-containing protein n=1 Tax=Paenalcaligenes niemegkensis TaxID=2895469 RepID=UPI001EE80E17|nr:DUF4198 domain-containing protein [Paenalcaligenes niemegkensis]MCQ9617581.1 DUF4198 domain-containing protein [Paenalcaligenes niemegkensis]